MRTSAPRHFYPGEAAIYNGSPWRISRRAPLIGEHNTEIFCDELDCLAGNFWFWLRVARSKRVMVASPAATRFRPLPRARGQKPENPPAPAPASS